MQKPKIELPVLRSACQRVSITTALMIGPFCQIGLSQAPSLSHQVFDESDLNAKIEERELRTKMRIKDAPANKGLNEWELMERARVGKKTLLEQEKIPANIRARYRQIWYLADDAYKAIRSRKFQPEKELIPFLKSLTDSMELDERAMLLEIFKEERLLESKDPRALGAECSEMLKLQTIVEGLSIESSHKETK